MYPNVKYFQIFKRNKNLVWTLKEEEGWGQAATLDLTTSTQSLWGTVVTKRMKNLSGIS